MNLDGNPFIGNTSLPTTGGWQTWETVNAGNFAFPVGQHVLRLNAVSGGWNLNYFNVAALGQVNQNSAYNNTPANIPGTIVAVNYDLGGEGSAYHDNEAANLGGEYRTSEGVDIGTCSDQQPYAIGWMYPGEWINYTVTVTKTASYHVSLMYTANTAGAISVAIDGKDVAGNISVPTTHRDADTVAWRQWHHWNLLRDAVTLDLPAGRTTLTVHILTNGNMNLMYFDFRPISQKPR